jgi:microsomal dipeptidase-like Zn-dependent dipeptidase
VGIVGAYRGLTHLGHYWVESCLKAGIVLDVKHADALTRAQIYRLAAQHNRPVVASHIGVSGKPTNVKGNALLVVEDFPDDRLKKSDKYNPWDINLHDDDIVQIHQLGGLMGLILDERILGSGQELKRVHTHGDWIVLLWNQIEHIYKTLRKAGVPAAQCFDSVCMGSDFDGFIEPIANVVTLSDYRHDYQQDGLVSQKLDASLLRILTEHRKVYREAGLEPYEVVRKILRENAMRFLEKHFV